MRKGDCLRFAGPTSFGLRILPNFAGALQKKIRTQQRAFWRTLKITNVGNMLPPVRGASHVTRRDDSNHRCIKNSSREIPEKRWFIRISNPEDRVENTVSGVFTLDEALSTNCCKKNNFLYRFYCVCVCLCQNKTNSLTTLGHASTTIYPIYEP